MSIGACQDDCFAIYSIYQPATYFVFLVYTNNNIHFRHHLKIKLVNASILFSITQKQKTENLKEVKYNKLQSLQKNI